MEPEDAAGDFGRRLRDSRARKLFWDKSFFHYLWTGGFFTLLNIALVWVGIDVLGLPTLLVSTVVIGGLFLARYIVYRLLKVM